MQNLVSRLSSITPRCVPLLHQDTFGSEDVLTLEAQIDASYDELDDDYGFDDVDPMDGWYSPYDDADWELFDAYVYTPYDDDYFPSYQDSTYCQHHQVIGECVACDLDDYEEYLSFQREREADVAWDTQALIPIEDELSLPSAPKQFGVSDWDHYNQKSRVEYRRRVTRHAHDRRERTATIVRNLSSVSARGLSETSHPRGEGKKWFLRQRKLRNRPTAFTKRAKESRERQMLRDELIEASRQLCEEMLDEE